MIASPMLNAMRELAAEHDCTRVEVQVYVQELAADGKTMLRVPHSVLYLPGLGWTTKDDIRTQSWGEARILANDSDAPAVSQQRGDGA